MNEAPRNTRSLTRPPSLTSIASAYTPATESLSSSPRPCPSTCVYNAPNPEVYVASTPTLSDVTNSAMYDLDMTLFESQNYLPLQEISPVQITGQSADIWPLSWPESTPEDHITSTKIHWQGDIMNSLSMLPSVPSLTRWGTMNSTYDEMPPTPTTSRQQVLCPSNPMASLSPGSQIVLNSSDRSWSHSKIPEPCQCLHQLGFVIEELDVGRNSTELSHWLPRHKDALQSSETLLSCPACRNYADPEHMTALVFLTERLMASCDVVVSAFLEGGLKDGVWVGNMEIDSPLEWRALVRTLLVFQLRGLDSLMSRIKGLLRSVGSEGSRQRVDLAQRRVRTMLHKLQGAYDDLDVPV